MKLPRLMILCPVISEARAMARAFSLPEKFAGGVAVREEVAVVVIGIRGVRLGRVAEMWKTERPSRVILAGLAGGLSPRLKVGDVVAECGWDVSPLPTGVHRERIHTAAGIVGSVAEKGRLFQETRAAAVEMEGGVVRAFLEGYPEAVFGQVRGISDGAGDVLDPGLLGVVDEEGRPMPGKVAGLLLRRPGAIGELMKLKKACDVALANVARVVKELDAAGWPAVTTCQRGAEGDGRGVREEFEKM